MRKLILLILSINVALATNGFAQQTQSVSETFASDTLLYELRKVQDELSRATSTIRSLRANQSRLQAEQDSLLQNLLKLSGEIESRSLAFTQATDVLGQKIDSTEVNLREQIASVDESVQSRTWIGILVILLVFAVISYVMWALLADIPKRVEATRHDIEEQLVSEYSTVAERLSELLQAAQTFGATATNAAPDHSLALKVANEINTMERNLSLMDNSVRGHKQLIRTVENLKNNLKAYGYEMESLLGRKFDLGLNLQVINAIPSDSLESGEEMITKVIIPQVNYNGRMIQSAQIEISVGS